MNRAALLALLPLTLLLRADGCGLGSTLFPPFPAATETTSTKAMTVRLDAQRPAQRFRLPVTITPPSGNARVDVVVARASRAFRLEIASAELDSEDPALWAQVSTGFASATFLSAVETQDVVLSVGVDPFETPVDEPLDVDINLIVAAPSDVDFDGTADGVVVGFGISEPLP